MEQEQRSSESLIQVKLDPKTKYFAVLLSKHSGITLSEFVGNCVGAVLELTTITVAGNELSYAELETQLWAEHPADRLALLGSQFPGEMTARERLLWQNVICRSQEFWHVPLTGIRINVTNDTFDFERLRERWADFDALNREQIAALAQSVKVDEVAQKQAMNAQIRADLQQAIARAQGRK